MIRALINLARSLVVFAQRERRDTECEKTSFSLSSHQNAINTTAKLTAIFIKHCAFEVQGQLDCVAVQLFTKKIFRAKNVVGER